MKRILLLLLCAILFTNLHSQAVWNNTTTGLSYNFQSIFFQEDTTAWSVTFFPAIIYTSTNYGGSWVSSQYIPGILLKDVCFLSDSVGLAGGGDAQVGGPVIYRTTDKGTNWSSVSLPSGTSLPAINGFLLIDSLNCIAFGNRGYVISTQDGGVSWGNLTINAVSPFTSNIWDLELVQGTLFTASNSGLYRGAGLNFTRIINQPVYSIEFKNGYGYAVSDTNFHYSLNNGASWSSRFVPASTTQVNSIAVNDSGMIFIATHNQEIYASNTFGANWTLETSINNSNDLFDVTSFKNDVWATGMNGRILKRSLISSSKELARSKNFYTIYPNPAKASVRIDGSYDRIELYNISGELVLEIEGDQTEIDISQLNPALYFTRIYSGNQVSHHKIIKQ